MKTALFIGRFQPFHSGHGSVVQSLAKDGFARVIIGIGSTQYSREHDNPLTLAERIACIAITLNETMDIPAYVIVPIPDIHDDDHWVAHVDHIVRHVTSQYTATYTGNALVATLFEHAGKPVRPIDRSITIDGTTIRTKIRQNNNDWLQYVNPSVQELIHRAVLQSKQSQYE